MTPRRQPARGFSLLEVVIAVGIFAGAVAVILALLSPLTRQAAASADLMTALRLPDAIRLELQRLAAAGGFDNLAGQTRRMTAPLPDTLLLAAARDATRISSLAYLPPAAADQIAEGEQFYLIEAWTFDAAPLAFDPAGAVLALHVRVSWPYHVPGAALPTPPAGREQVTFNVALDR